MESGGVQLVRDTTEQIVASSAKDHGQIVKLIQLAMQIAWFSGRLVLRIFFWAPVLDRGDGCAGGTRSQTPGWSGLYCIIIHAQSLVDVNVETQ